MNPTILPKPPKIKLSDLTRVILAADLSSQPNFRDMGRSHPHLLEIAHRAMSDPNMARHMKERAADAKIVADAVWWDYLKPILLALLMDLKGIKQDDAEKMLTLYFVDESIRYETRTPRPQR